MGRGALEEIYVKQVNCLSLRKGPVGQSSKRFKMLQAIRESLSHQHLLQVSYIEAALLQHFETDELTYLDCMERGDLTCNIYVNSFCDLVKKMLAATFVANEGNLFIHEPSLLKSCPSLWTSFHENGAE